MANRIRTDERRSGVTLTELMVALAITIIVAAQAMYAYSMQFEKSGEQERIVESQGEVRLASRVLLSDLRMAGFMVDTTAGLGSNDGGTSGSDVICTSDPEVIDPAVVDTASKRLSGASLTSAVGAGNTTLSFVTSTMDIDSDGDVDFTAGGGVLISGGDETHCARVVSVSGSGLVFDPPAPAGFTVAASEAIVVPAIVYDVTGTQLSRNGTVLSNQIEDIQIEYGIDVDGNGLIEGAEFPIDSLTGQDLSRIRTARIHVTGRASRPVPGFAGQFAAVANRTASAADEFMRRRTSADATLRNLR